MKQTPIKYLRGFFHFNFNVPPRYFFEMAKLWTENRNFFCLQERIRNCKRLKYSIANVGSENVPHFLYLLLLIDISQRKSFGENIFMPEAVIWSIEMNARKKNFATHLANEKAKTSISLRANIRDIHIWSLHLSRHLLLITQTQKLQIDLRKSSDFINFTSNLCNFKCPIV